MVDTEKVTATSFLKSVTKFSISTWFGFFIGVISVSLTTRIFTPEINGILNIFNSTVQIFISIVLLGMGSVVARFFYEPPKGWSVQQLFTRCMFISIAFLIICSSFCLTSLTDSICFQLFQTNSIIIKIMFVLSALSTMVLVNFLSQYYRYSNNIYQFNIQQIFIQFFNKLFVIVAAFVNPNIEVVLIFNAFGMFVLMLCYITYQRKEVISWKKGGWLDGDIIPLYRFALFSWPGEMLLYCSDFVLPFLVTSLLGAWSMGIYSSANFFVSAFLVLQGGFRTYWSAFMYKHYKDESNKIIKIHSYVFLGVIVLMSAAILFQHIAYMLIGESFHESRLFFTLVLIQPLLLLLEQTTSYGISLSKKNEQGMVICLLSLLVNIFSIYFWVRIYGLLGAAIGVSFTAVIRFLLMTWRGQIYYKSIRSKSETILGLLILLCLAASNVVFYDQYWRELIVVLFTLCITAWVYRCSIREVFDMFIKS